MSRARRAPAPHSICTFRASQTKRCRFPRKQQRRSKCTGERILLVEDDTSVRDFLFSVLEEHGYHVVAALDGSDALEIAARQRHEIQLLIADIVMPGMNGKQLPEGLAAGSAGAASNLLPATPPMSSDIAACWIAKWPFC
jgi:PleD family two-component response regulator